MTRVVLAVSIAALLLLFTALGWALHWLWRRSHRLAGSEEAWRNDLTARLHAAELARDLAERTLTTEREAVQAGAATETADLARRLAEREVELAATMDALREARQTAAEWRSAYEGLVKEDRDDP